VRIKIVSNANDVAAIPGPPGSVQVSMVFTPATIAAFRAAGFLAEGTSEPYDIALAAASMIRAAWQCGIRALPPAPGAGAIPPAAEPSPADESEELVEADAPAAPPANGHSPPSVKVEVPIPTADDDAARRRYFDRMAKVQRMPPEFAEVDAE
jgi:hypothetical protein